jgi:hypothetical protein
LAEVLEGAFAFAFVEAFGGTCTSLERAAVHLLVRTQNGASVKALGNHQQLDSAVLSLLHLGVLDAQLTSDQDLAKHVAIKKEVVARFLEARNNLRPTPDQSQQHHV